LNKTCLHFENEEEKTNTKYYDRVSPNNLGGRMIREHRLLALKFALIGTPPDHDIFSSNCHL